MVELPIRAGVRKGLPLILIQSNQPAATGGHGERLWQAIILLVPGPAQIRLGEIMEFKC